MRVLEGLRDACPALALRTDAPALAAGGLDAMRPSRGRPEFAALATRPLAVAEPASPAEVAALVRWAAAARIPLVARGGGSGLMGAAAVLAPTVVVDLRRLGAVAVEADACLVRAGAGATLAQVDAALAPHGLMLGHDPWTVGVATVGGALATNGLGYLGARAGSFGAQVRALEAVLADGTIVRTPASPARSAGLDVARLLIGTEGTLGIITEATLLALPVPEERVIHAWHLPSFDAGVAVATELRRTGVRLACLELSADDARGPAELLLVFDGLRGEATLHAERAARLLAAADGRRLGNAEAKRQWEERHAIAERWAAARRGGGGEWPPDGSQFDYAHVGVPLGGLSAVRATAHALVARHGLALVEEGLWHWPELYSVVVSGPPGSAEGVRAAIDGVCAAAIDAGGTLEYCHGVGWKLAHLAEREHGAAGLAVLRRLKAALDPANIMNPGKCGL
ncbi:MAG TPA: FAD-binding oxidoreductase [Candidatus Limnocylindria bacterium]|nr:FAD-binding oxidoreductase [Candidatus Limnocylindria bacterium]